MRFLCCALVLMTTVAAAADRPARLIPSGESTRVRFLKLIDRPRVPLQASAETMSSDANVEKIRFEYSSEDNVRVPGLMLRPKGSETPRPVVIVLHGTGGSKQAMEPLLRKFVEQGVTAVAIDARYSGERAGGLKPGEAYRAAILETWRTGKGFPFLYDTVWDVMRLIDYLETRPDVAANQIGALGISKGGMELYLAAAVDSRLVAAVPCIGVQSFDWALEHNAWQSRVSTIQSAVDAAARESGLSSLNATFVRSFYDRVAPGVHQEFDGPAMLPLIAPRPLLVINGDRDDRTPLPGLELCVQAARRVYEQAQAAHQFKFILQPDTQHAVTPESEKLAIDWLVHQLKTTDAGK